MAPRVLVQGSDEELYGRVNMDRAAAVRFGVVGYTDGVDKALALTERVGDKPLVVKAVAAGGAHAADVLLSTDDAARVVAANMKSSFFKECRVVFVVG
jgi:biotin carboxylase